MSGILTRIKIKHVEGAEIAYLLEKEFLTQLGLEPSPYDPTETFINVGDEFSLNDRQFKVVKILTKFFNQTFEPDNLGMNVYRLGEDYPFNFQITYEVDDVR